MPRNPVGMLTIAFIESATLTESTKAKESIRAKESVRNVRIVSCRVDMESV